MSLLSQYICYSYSLLLKQKELDLFVKSKQCVQKTKQQKKNYHPNMLNLITQIFVDVI